MRIWGLFKQKRLASVHAGGLGASALWGEMEELAFMKVTFILKTTVDLFFYWLKHYTSTAPDLDFPTENGRIILQYHASPHRLSGPAEVHLSGILVRPSDTFEEAKAKARSTGDGWLGTLISFEAMPLAPERVEVTAECNHPAVMHYFEELLMEIGSRWPEAKQWREARPRVAVEDTGARRGPTLRAQIRGEVFKRLKDEHPEWSQARVAMEACEELGEEVTPDTVRNTYRAMGWKWKREGRRACPAGKLKASLVEGEVMSRVMDRILTPMYARDLLDAANGKLNEEAASLDGRIARVRRRLSETNRAIYNLLDLAEQQGSAAARDRLAKRESEKASLEGELQSLLKRKARTKLEVSEEVMTVALSKMRE